MPTSIPSTLTTSSVLTLYSDGFAQVQETRTLPPIEDGIVYYEDVAEQIETNSLLIDGLVVRAFHFEYDLANEHQLLENYKDREIKLFNVKTGEERIVRLLSTSGGLILQDPVSKDFVLRPKGELHLPESKDVFTQPTLVWTVAEQTALEVKVTYLTKGLSWEPSYVMDLKGDLFNLSGWISITNHSGKTFKQSTVKLLAGNVHRVSPIVLQTAMFEKSAQVDLAKNESFSDYHLYTLQGQLTIHDQQQKQFQLLAAKNAQSKTLYVANQYSKHPDIQIEFENTKENGLGFPLPAGIVKMFRENPLGGNPQFIGEDRLEGTAANEMVHLKAGEAFDITIESGQVESYRKDNSNFIVYEYQIRNAKNVPIVIHIHHTIYEKVWDVTESNFPWERHFNEIRIPVEVPANGSATARFTIRYDEKV